MSGIRVIECKPYPGSSHETEFSNAPIEFMNITEDESKYQREWGAVNWKMFKEFGINMKFIVIPNGLYLPVLASHYQ